MSFIWMGGLARMKRFLPEDLRDYAFLMLASPFHFSIRFRAFETVLTYDDSDWKMCGWAKRTGRIERDIRLFDFGFDLQGADGRAFAGMSTMG